MGKDDNRDMINGLFSKALREDSQAEPLEEPKEIPTIGDMIVELLKELHKSNPEAAERLLRDMEMDAFASQQAIPLDYYQGQFEREVKPFRRIPTHISATGNTHLAMKMEMAVAKMEEVFNREVIPYFVSIGKLD